MARPIRMSVVFYLFSIAITALLSIGFIIVTIENDQFSKFSQELSENFSKSVWNYDIPTLRSIADAGIRWNNIEKIHIEEVDGSTLIEVKNENLMAQGDFIHFFFPRVMEEQTISYQNEIIGSLEISFVSTRFYLFIAAMVLISLITAIIGNLVTSRYQNRRLKDSLDQVLSLQEQLVEAHYQGALGSLLRGLAHEINTPLGNAMLLANSLISMETKELCIDESGAGKDSPDLQSMLKLLTSSLDRISKIIERIKQLEMVTKSEEYRHIPLTALVQESAYLATQDYPEESKNCDIVQDSSIDLYGPKTALVTIFSELISNAFKHQNLGNQRILISISAKETEIGKIEVRIADSGDPIPKNLREKMFEPFTRAKPQKDHMGIGLHIVSYLITNLLGGRIHYQYEHGKNVFILNLKGKSLHN